MCTVQLFSCNPQITHLLGCMSVCLVGLGTMSSRLLFLVTMLLLNYSIYAQGFPSYRDCAPYTIGSSIIQYHFGQCGLLDVIIQNSEF